MKYLIIFVLALTIASCNTKEVYNHTHTVKGPWVFADSLVYDYVITDTIVPYNLVLTVNHSNEYPYENLYINATTIFPDGYRTTNPVSLELADDHGQWQGQCSGQKCKAVIEIAQKAYFEKMGKYRLVLEQFSRMDSLPGIQAIQLQILQSEDKNKP